MADAAISFAVEKQGNAVIQKVVFLKGVEEQVRWLKDELQSMQCFLKDAAEKQRSDERIRKWIADVREVAHDAEDAIETFFLKVEKDRGTMRSWACFPVHEYHACKVGKQIESIRTRLDDIGRRRERYGIGSLGEGVESSRRISAENIVERRRRLAPRQQDKEVVGLNEDVETLVERWIRGEKKGLSLAAIVGMGGIGKSTLAMKIYNHGAVAGRFECRAWVVVSSEFTPEDIIKQIMMQLRISDATLKLLESMDDKLRLQEMLQGLLREKLEGKQYFIVLDDVWEPTHWETLSSAFPDQQDKTSRLLFTSRNQIITEHQGYIHKIKLLNADPSWELLLKTALVGKTNCPPDLENIGREIVERCHGLPLAITVAGGLLVNQGESRSGWDKVLKQIRNYQSEMSEVGKNVNAILELSYNNLPPNLKPCFLSLGFFKEDATIRARKLVNLWVAEGFIPEQAGGEETMEETARGYLEELINGNLVQVQRMKRLEEDGAVTCQMHDLLRQLSIQKAKEEIGFEIVSEPEAAAGPRSSTASSRKPRHRAAYLSGSINTKRRRQRRHLRSLFFHGSVPFMIAFTYPSSYWKSFKLLRVLDFEDFYLQIVPEAIGELIGLRYLGLRNTQITGFSHSMGRLKNLEVLDLAGNFMLGDLGLQALGHVIRKLESLRHLYLPDVVPYSILDYDLKVETLKNLQTLTGLQYWNPECPERMTNLRKLSMNLSGGWVDAVRLWKSLAKPENLLSVKLRWNGSIIFQLGLSELRRLTKLKLEFDEVSLLANEPCGFPPNLSYLSLRGSISFELTIPLLESIPSLLYLKLDSGKDDDLVISADGFPRLKVLSLHSQIHLTNLQVGRGAMPELRRLEICDCEYLGTENLPAELRARTVIVEKKWSNEVELFCPQPIRDGLADIGPELSWPF